MQTRLNQNLLIDADDTLWHNNVYFERAIDGFTSHLNHPKLAPRQVRQVLNEVEREYIVTHGYGSHSFAAALVGTFERLAVHPVTPADHEILNGFVRQIAAQPIELYDGVRPTLKHLAARHRLILVTKGNVREQSGKIERSGLREFFSAIEIVPEKNVATYRALLAHYRLAKDATWMVGNSPLSDINPALSAGLNAVFIPNDLTWVIENGEVAAAPESACLLVLERFADLPRHF
jgi:putative hydrolase of the HAD superfamily